MSRADVDAEFIVAAAEVLREGVPGADHSRTAELFQAAHRSQPGLQPAVIGFDRVVRVLLRDVAGGGQQFIHYSWVCGRTIRGDLRRPWRVLERAARLTAGAFDVQRTHDQLAAITVQVARC